MQFRNIIAVLLFLIANICFASAETDNGVVFITMTTDIEVTSTVYVDTVTMTGRPTTTQDPIYVPLSTISPNNTSIVPSATGTASHNSTVSPAPTKGPDSAATTFSGSIHVAVAAGAIAAVLGML